MKKTVALICLLYTSVASLAQNTTITYSASNALISNPERGFYRFTVAHPGTYTGLDEAVLTDYRMTNNITLIYRNFRLNDFINTPISDSYLTNMQADFTAIRNAGLKCVIRFSYSEDDTAAVLDATKTTILSHILQIKPLLESNSDIIAVMQAGFIGTWGEWYSTSQADFGGWGYNQTDLTNTNLNHRKDVLNALLNALPADRMIQIRYPAFKMNAYSSTALTSTQAYSETTLARMGHHNDCFLAPSNDYGTYDNTAVEYPFLEQDTKYVPMGGETCALNSPRTDCAGAIYEMSRFHWSFLNLDYFPDVINGFQSNNCFADIQNNLGYRLELHSATLPQAVALGSTVPVSFTIKNVGYAAPFNDRKVYLVLKNTATNHVYRIMMSADPRTWLGPNDITFTENLALPHDITTGNYKLYLSLPDSYASITGRPEYAIRLANDNMWESKTGFNSLNYTLNITDVLGIANNAKFNIGLYPIPANDQLTIDLDQVKDYKIALYNALGQSISLVTNATEPNSMLVDTSDLSEGLYFIEFSKDDIKDTRKIIVKH